MVLCFDVRLHVSIFPFNILDCALQGSKNWLVNLDKSSRESSISHLFQVPWQLDLHPNFFSILSVFEVMYLRFQRKKCPRVKNPPNLAYQCEELKESILDQSSLALSHMQAVASHVNHMQMGSTIGIIGIWSSHNWEVIEYDTMIRWRK